MKAWTDAMDEPAQNCVNLLWMSAIMKDAQSRGAGVMLLGLAGNATISADGWEAMTTWFRTGHWFKMFEFANNLRNRGELSLIAADHVAQRSGGDLAVQAKSDEPQAAFHVVRQPARLVGDVAAICWVQPGLSRAASARSLRAT